MCIINKNTFCSDPIKELILMKKVISLLFFIVLLSCFTGVSAENINIGVSAEYRPFVYYDYNNELTGLDIELLKEIGNREGFTPKFIDMAFDGLIDSASVGQINLIAGAFSITPERREQLLFSQTYYTNEAISIVTAQSDLTRQTIEQKIADLRIGVQRGTSFDQWVKTNLVAPGYLSTQNVYSFATLDSAIKGLLNGTIDILYLDEDSYKHTYQDSGKFKIIDDNFGDEQYAFAAYKGSEQLISRIDDGLQQMTADGSLQRIIDKYTQAAGDEAEITITRPSIIVRTPEALPTPTPIPPIDQPYNCKNVMVFMADVTYPDGSKINPGQDFTKTWRIYNNGSCKWYEGYTIEFVGGDFMGGRATTVPTLTIPGLTVDVSIQLQAPQAPGQYTGYFQMRAPDGTYFGPKMDVSIIVTTEAVSAPPAGAPPVITRFQPNYYKGGKKFCPTVYWTVTDATQIRLSINNKPLYTTTQGSGSIELCPGGGKGDYVYGIVAEGTKRVSYVFTYTNTGE